MVSNFLVWDILQRQVSVLDGEEDQLIRDEIGRLVLPHDRPKSFFADSEC